MVVIAISGQAGCGTSTVARLLAKKLRLKYFSAGEYYKKVAGRHGKGKPTERSLQFLGSKKGAGRGFNINIEKMQARAAKRGNVVIDSKIGVRYLRNAYDLGVWLKAPVKTRARRYVKREGFAYAEALKYVKEKDSLERENFKKLYGFDSFSQEKIADLVVNTGDRTPEQIVNLIVKKLRTKKLI